MDILTQIYHALATDLMVQAAVGLGGLTALLYAGKALVNKFKKPKVVPLPPVVTEELPTPQPEDYVVEELPPEAPDPARKPDAPITERPKRQARPKKQVDAEGAPIEHTKEETMPVGKKNKRSDKLNRNKTR